MIMTMLLAPQPERGRDGFGPMVPAGIRRSRLMVQVLLETIPDIRQEDEPEVEQAVGCLRRRGQGAGGDQAG